MYGLCSKFTNYFKGVDEDKLQSIVGYKKSEIEELRSKITEVEGMYISESSKTELNKHYLAKIEEIKSEMRAELARNTGIAEEFIESL